MFSRQIFVQELIRASHLEEPRDDRLFPEEVGSKKRRTKRSANDPGALHSNFYETGFMREVSFAVFSFTLWIT